MADRSRRERKAKLDKLAELKRIREGGARVVEVRREGCNPLAEHSNAVQEEDDGRLYDEVTEDQYKSIVRGRLAKDDFVVDDGVRGYMDNGVDDFEEADEEPESDEDGRKGKCAYNIVIGVAVLMRVQRRRGKLIPKPRTSRKQNLHVPP